MIVSTFIATLLYISLIITLILGVYTLNRCESRKRMTFVGILAAVFLYVLGYLMEINAVTTDGGFIATKVMYVGASFLAPICLIFTLDYCEVVIGKKLQILIVSIPFVVILLLWTTEFHDLIYIDYWINMDAPVTFLDFTPGPLYYANHIYAGVCTFVFLITLLHRLKVWGLKYRNNLKLVLLAVGVPLLANSLYLLNLRAFEINYVPASLILLVILFYINIVRHNLFDIVPKASEMALKSIKEAFILVDSDCCFISANESAEKIFPDLETIQPGESMYRVNYWPPELCRVGESVHKSHIMFNLPCGKFYNANVSQIFARNKKVLGYIVLIQDITESVLLTKKLEEMAFTDDLTGILSRQHFMNSATAMIERANRVKEDAFIIMLDVDDFKRVNDEHGHVLGDMVLKCVADRIKIIMRHYDLFGRYGGDEFILLVPETNEKVIKLLSERLRIAICESPMVFGEIQLAVSASFGVASAISTKDFSEAVRMADEALYQAKSEGRNRVIICKE